MLVRNPLRRSSSTKGIDDLDVERCYGDVFNDAALQVARQDRAVDEEYESIQRQTITFMLEDPRSIRRALDVMWVVRSLERIGDHAKNIGEYIIYMVHGKDVRHTSLDDVERELRDYQAAAADRQAAGT